MVRESWLRRGVRRKKSDMKGRTSPLFSAAMWLTLVLLPSRVLACACCAHPGEYQIDFVKPDAYQLSVIERLRFGTKANLFTGEADPEVAAKGLAHPVDTYSLSGSLVGNVWKLTFRYGDETGTLNLPLPAKMLRFAADIHGELAKPGFGEPLLYKEWRFEGEVNGTGFFKAGITAGTKYVLVFQGRGNSCDVAENFAHWQLKITGKKADYAFYGELGTPLPDDKNE
jgi:hypothetical protein